MADYFHVSENVIAHLTLTLSWRIPAQKAFSCALAAILNIIPLGIQNYCVRTWHLAGDSDQNFERFPFHPYMDLASADFVK
jgi:hypothetical protein